MPSCHPSSFRHCYRCSGHCCCSCFHHYPVATLAAVALLPAVAPVAAVSCIDAFADIAAITVAALPACHHSLCCNCCLHCFHCMSLITVVGCCCPSLLLPSQSRCPPCLCCCCHCHFPCSFNPFPALKLLLLSLPLLPSLPSWPLP